MIYMKRFLGHCSKIPLDFLPFEMARKKIIKTLLIMKDV